MKFSEKAKYLRINAGITQQELSMHLGITASAIGYLENGKREPTGSTLIAYAKYFDVSIDSLVGLDADIEDSIFTPSPPDKQVQPLFANSPISQLSTDEQEFLSMYQALPSYLKDSIFSELKGMYKAYLASKPEKSTRRA